MPVVKKCRMIWVTIIALIIATIPALASSSPAEIDPRAQAILQKCVQRYATLKTYRDQTDYSLTSEDKDGTTTTKEHMEIYFQAAPVRLRVDVTSDEAAQNYQAFIVDNMYHIFQTNNGTSTMWFQQLAGNDYGRKLLLEKYVPSSSFAPFLAGINPCQPPWGLAISSLTIGKSAVVDGAPVYNIKAILKADSRDSLTYLIDQNDYLIRGIRHIVSRKKTGTQTTIEMHHGIAIDAAIDKSTFDTSSIKHDISYDLNNRTTNSVLKIGQPFPTIKGFDFKGDNFDLATYKGKVLLLYFWASWCPTCRYDTPYMKMLYQKYHPEGLEIIGISEDMGGRWLQQYIDSTEIPWINLYDIDHKLQKKDGVPHIPYSVLVAADGTVSSLDLQRLELEGQVVKLLKEKKNTPATGDN